MAVTQQEHNMRKQTDDLSFLRSMCLPRFFLEHSRELPAVNADSRRLDRKPVPPPRGRSVISMKEPLPLYLSHSTTSSDFPLHSQLRRIQSAPTTFGEAKEAPSEKIKPATFPFRLPFSNRLSCIAKDMQAPAEIAAPQTLFDLGIFQSSGKGSGRPSPLSLTNEVEGVRRGQSLGSPFEENRTADCYEEEGDKHGLGATSRTSSESRSRIGLIELDDSNNSRPGGIPITSRALSGSNHSLNSSMDEAESPLSRTFSSQTSWLDDPSDDEEDYSSSSQCSLPEVQSPDLDSSEPMDVELGSENLHEPSIEYAAALTPRKATLIDVPSSRSSISSGNDQPPSPSSMTHRQSRPSQGGLVTPPSSPRSSSLVTTDYEQKRHTTAETQGLTILTPPPTPEKGTPRPSLSYSRLSAVLSKLEQAVATDAPQIDSSVVDLLRETIRSQSHQSSRTSVAPSTRTPYSWNKNTHANTKPKQAYLQDVFGILPSSVYALVQALNLLDEWDITPSSSTRPEDDGDDSASRARIECLRRRLKECVVRGVVESNDAGREALVRALGAVARLAELR